MAPGKTGTAKQKAGRPRISFLGAAGEVTGSMHLVEAGPYRILLDCGLFQGRREESRRKNEEFSVDCARLDAVVLSHAHIDHAGRLPLIVKRGYDGPIYCTPATRDLSAIMLPDSGHIQESDAAFLKKRGHHGVEPLYTMSEARQVASHMVAIPYGRRHEILSGVRLTFTDAGHILGSASVLLELDLGGRTRRIVFSGDIGRSGLPIIRDPRPPEVPDLDALIIESTYAGRVHESVEEAQGQLAETVTKVARRGGKIFIPAFAVGRTQEVLYELHGLLLAGKIPEIPIYVDSPLAVDATDIFRLHPEAFDHAEQLIEAVSEVFRFRLVRYVRKVDESKQLNTIRGPAIIIAASGMAESGRILHHLRNGLGDHRNMVLIVGWQASHTLGERLRAGARQVRIFGEELPVRAEVRQIAGYSAHGDRNDLTTWVKGLGAKPARAFCVHGEAGLQPMAQLLKDLGIPEVHIPQRGEQQEIA
ncbi:MAG TPA: MBL fold metallo-hydrolase [Gemmatimonadales bacterium]|nr:MBL fold metallo-hydrolase [Gemmatimonadales bacterium]